MITATRSPISRKSLMLLISLVSQVIAMFALAFLVLAMFAIQGARAASLPSVAPIVQKVSNKALTAKSVFHGPDGLTGVIVAGPGGYKTIAWATHGGRSLFLNGTLYDHNGENLTNQFMYSTGLMLPPGKVMKDLIKNGMPIHEGTAGPTIVVIFDPNCIFCHLFHKSIMPLVEAGKVQVDYIMVGIIKPDSFAKASSILQAKDPAKALAIDENGFDVKQEEGGYPVDKILHARYETVVQNNAVAMRKLGSTGTPTLLYCDKSGNVHMQAGMSQQADAFVAGLGSCKE